ncbi:MAG: hypothetical protein JOY59_03595 [Candidatus Eremiobacteraeota bacterium]|nr:hypothetical protein [Candidatus Eremiobacteraeota bacterium]
MTKRVTALTAAVIGMLLVFAQIAFPLLDLFHTWQYALGLTLVLAVLIGYIAPALGGDDGIIGKRLCVAMCGALVIVLAGLVSGLLGPDTTRIVHAPGTVAPLPDLGGAAFFPNADATTIANGRSMVVFRRMRHRDMIVDSAAPKFLVSESVMLLQQPHPAAYLEATDSAANHLTITQPSGAAFLSPVLLFRDSQAIAGAEHPVDGFALPALGRSLKAVYFSAAETAQLHVAPEQRGKPAVLYALEERGGTPGTIAFASNGQTVALAGIRLHATLGTYPQLVVASCPHPYALVLGLLLFIAGIAWALAARAVQNVVTLEKVNRSKRPAGTTIS